MSILMWRIISSISGGFAIVAFLYLLLFYFKFWFRSDRERVESSDIERLGSSNVERLTNVERLIRPIVKGFKAAIPRGYSPYLGFLLLTSISGVLISYYTYDLYFKSLSSTKLIKEIDHKNLDELDTKIKSNLESIHRCEGCELSRIDFSNEKVDLHGFNFSKANLSLANLSKVDLGEADLSEANLSRADLFYTDLSKADLSLANLSRANLSLANLSRADLLNANLSGANLGGTNLGGTNLSGANLLNANLSGADLSKANLSGANLDSAYLIGTKNLTNSQTKSSCFWERAYYNNPPSLNQKYIKELKQDKASDPVKAPDCREFLRY